jgi:hypothetical protein
MMVATAADRGDDRRARIDRPAGRRPQAGATVNGYI